MLTVADLDQRKVNDFIWTKKTHKKCNMADKPVRILSDRELKLWGNLLPVDSSWSRYPLGIGWQTQGWPEDGIVSDAITVDASFCAFHRHSLWTIPEYFSCIVVTTVDLG